MGVKRTRTAVLPLQSAYGVTEPGKQEMETYQHCLAISKLPKRNMIEL